MVSINHAGSPEAPNRRSATVAEFQALISSIETSPILVPDLSAAALGDVLSGVITGEGPTTLGRMHFSRSLDDTDATWCERILLGAGGSAGAPVTRLEAERLFEIDAAATERSDNGHFDDLMVKAVTHHVLAVAGRPVPPRDIALDRTTSVASWASQFAPADIDGEVLRWIASHVKSKKRLGGPLMTLAALLIGASASPMTATVASIFDLMV
jgi:hypothetical protein